LKDSFEAIEGENDVGFRFLEPIVTRTKVFRAMPGRHLVTGGGEVRKSKSCSGYFE